MMMILRATINPPKLVQFLFSNWGMRASPCWRPAAAAPRTPPTSWWRTWWTSARAPWAGGVLVGPSPMARPQWLMVAMASLDGTSSLALTCTRATRGLEISHQWIAALTIVKAKPWVGSFSGPSARRLPPLWVGRWLNVSRVPPMPCLPSSWRALSTQWLFLELSFIFFCIPFFFLDLFLLQKDGSLRLPGPGAVVGSPPSSTWGSRILPAADTRRRAKNLKRWPQ